MILVTSFIYPMSGATNWKIKKIVAGVRGLSGFCGSRLELKKLYTTSSYLTTVVDPPTVSHVSLHKI